MFCKNSLLIRAVCVVFKLICFHVSDCGRVKRIVGGIEVECGRQPRIASLHNATSSRPICGATLLSENYALTAAHCVENSRQKYYLQLRNYCEIDEPPIVKVLDVKIHELYNKYTRAHDIALLRVCVGLDEISWLKQDILPASSFGVHITGECAIYGYGITHVNSNETSETLLAANVKIVSMDECYQMLGPHVAPSWNSGMMCAIGDGGDSCQGDSGGPILCDCGGSTIQAISSHGLSCAVPGVPAVYTSIVAHLRWLRDSMHH